MLEISTLNKLPQTSPFFERETICLASLAQKWAWRDTGSYLRWCIHQDVATLRSIRAAHSEYQAGLMFATFSHRTGGRTKRAQLKLPL